MFQKIKSYVFLLVIALTKLSSCLMSFEFDGDVYDCSSRYSFYSTCEKHFRDNYTTADSWMEADDNETIAAFNEYLNFIPQCYSADCYHCYDCNGVGFDLYQGCYSPVDDHDAFSLLYRHNAKPFSKEGREWIYNCKRTSNHCEEFCWNGTYFRRWNHKYIHFFKHFLQYCSENSFCKCYWPEINERQADINDFVYNELLQLAENNVIKSDFSTFWKGTYYTFYEGKKTISIEYEPNTHGIASSLTAYTFFYSQYHQMLLSIIDYIDADSIFDESEESIENIYSCLEKLQDDFSFKYSYCLRRHPHPKIYYERGMLEMHKGNYDNAFTDISNLMHLAKQKNINISAEMYHQEGQIYTELGMYDQAIDALTASIELDPTNRGAYFNRAQAYFEKGNFDAAIQDFTASKVYDSHALLKSNIAVRDAILKGLLEGGKESVQNFFPSLCQTAYGLGMSLWAFTEHPVDCTTKVVNACFDISCNLADFFKNVNFDSEILIDEIGQVLGKLDRYSQQEKAYLTGYLIGKYGVDIFANSAAVKYVSQYKKLKDANRFANLETLASEKSSKAIRTAALNHAEKLKKFFKNIKLHNDRQGKHIKGHKNYLQQLKNGEKTGDLPSILTYSDPEALLKKYAGTGILHGKLNPGIAGFKETVVCDEVIGEWYNFKTKQYFKTKRCTIHYDKDGYAHIVPSIPEIIK